MNVNTQGIDAAAKEAHGMECSCPVDGHWTRWRDDIYGIIVAYLNAVEGK